MAELSWPITVFPQTVLLLFFCWCLGIRLGPRTGSASKKCMRLLFEFDTVSLNNTWYSLYECLKVPIGRECWKAFHRVISELALHSRCCYGNNILSNGHETRREVMTVTSCDLDRFDSGLFPAAFTCESEVHQVNISYSLLKCLQVERQALYVLLLGRGGLNTGV
jgi:hypothetical protein